MKALGAPLRHFGFNRWWAVFFGFGVTMFGTLAVATLTIMRRDSEWWEPLVGISFFALNLYLLVRTLVSSATVCESGLRYKTLRGAGEILWDEVEKFRYSIVVTRHHGFIKSTQYTMILVDKDGRRAELGSNVEHPEELAALLLNKLQPLLLQKTVAAYEAGRTLDLGAIKVSREGISISIPLKKLTIPSADVVGCSIDRGRVIISGSVGGRAKNYAILMRSVDNVFALVELVNRRIVHRAAAASSGR
jgi:hypothetical protein